MNVSLTDVVEAHRVMVGAKSVHVTLKEGATPEGLAAEMEKTRILSRSHNAFRQEERDAVQIFRLRQLLRQIDVHARKGEIGEIIRKCDIIPNARLPEDTEWMAAERLKRNEPLPEGYVPAPKNTAN